MSNVVPITAGRSGRRTGARRPYVDVAKAVVELERSLILQRRFRELVLRHEPWMFEYHCYLHALVHHSAEAQRLVDLLRGAERQPALEIVRAG